MPEREEEPGQQTSDDARRRADDALRQQMAAQQRRDEAKDNAAAQADNGTQPADASSQSSSVQTEGQPVSSENTIGMGPVTADNIENVQAETINNTTTGAVYNVIVGKDAFKRGFEMSGMTFGPLDTGKERFKPLERKPEDIELPVEGEKIRSWYRKLPANEKCFIQAMAVFQGAPEDEIFHISKILFEDFQKGKRARKESQETSDTEEYISEDTMIESVERWTVCQHVKNADRLFWQDTDKDGVSAFGVAVTEAINYVARRSVGYSVDQDFLKNVEVWSGRGDGEYGWRAARVLGMIRWRENEPRFQNKAEQWAKSRWTYDWERAANFFYGAYLYEYEHHSEEEGNPSASQAPDLSASSRPAFPGKKRKNWTGTAEKQKSEADKLFQKTVGEVHQQPSRVLALLEQWITRAHMDWQGNVGPGYVIAQAYRWIGQKSLQAALNGLKTLLDYPFNKQQKRVELPVLVFVTAVWSHVTLANAGYVYEVLRYLAEQIKELAFEQSNELSSEQSARRAIRLDAFFLVFFLLVRLSLSGVHNGTYSRSLKLDNPPALPDTQGRDMLLAAVLSQKEPELRTCLVQLFSMAIIEEQEDSAFELLEEWAKIALQKHEVETRRLGQAYRQFLLDIGEMVLEWCEELEEHDEATDFSLKLEIYKQKLDEWVEKYAGKQPPSPIEACAIDVLESLTF